MLNFIERPVILFGHVTGGEANVDPAAENSAQGAANQAVANEPLREGIQAVRAIRASAATNQAAANPARAAVNEFLPQVMENMKTILARGIQASELDASRKIQDLDAANSAAVNPGPAAVKSAPVAANQAAANKIQQEKVRKIMQQIREKLARELQASDEADQAVANPAPAVANPAPAAANPAPAAANPAPAVANSAPAVANPAMEKTLKILKQKLRR